MREDGANANPQEYPPELKERAVAMVLKWRRERGRQNGGLNEVAKKLGVALSLLAEGARAREPRASTRQRDPEVGVGLLRGGARPPTDQVVAYIDANKASFGVEPICEVLQVAPSTYYASKARPPCRRALRDAQLRPEIERVYAQNRHVYGPRKVWRAMNREGISISTNVETGLQRHLPALRSEPDRGGREAPAPTSLVTRKITSGAPGR